jgi:hypothetical protein
MIRWLFYSVISTTESIQHFINREYCNSFCGFFNDDFHYQNYTASKDGQEWWVDYVKICKVTVVAYLKQ